MKNKKNMDIISIVSILIISIGYVLSIISLFFNKILPKGIISSNFPPFYIFFIGLILLIVGLFLFSWKKIKNMGKKRIKVVISIFLIIILLISIPITLFSSVQHTGRFVLAEQIVWYANASVNTETGVQHLFESHIMDFWEPSLNILKNYNKSYPGNACPLLEHMRIYPPDSYSSMNRWGITIPVIPQGADWRISFFGGCIEVSEDGWWHCTRFIYFNVEKETGIVRVEVC